MDAETKINEIVNAGCRTRNANNSKKSVEIKKEMG